MIKCVALRQTCGGCPSQWEGETDDGREIYIRYRWGRLSLSVWPKGDPSKEEFISEQDIGDPLDGHLDEDRMRARLAEYLEFKDGAK